MYNSTKKRKQCKARMRAATILAAQTSLPYYSGKLYPSGHGSIGRIPVRRGGNGGEDKRLKFEVGNTRTIGVVNDQNVCIHERKFFRTKKDKIPTPPIPPPDDLKKFIVNGNCQASATPKGLTSTIDYDMKNCSSGGGIGQDEQTEYENLSSIGLSSLPSPHKLIKRGSKGLTRKGKVLIREYSSFLVSREKKKFALYTLTCPYTSTDDVTSYTLNIQEITRRYFQELKREYARKGEPFTYCAVYEIQNKRMLKYGQVALHVHYLSRAKYTNSNEYVLTFAQIKKIYQRVCEKVIHAEADFSCSVDGALVKKDAGAYMSKYMSKSEDLIDLANQLVPDFFPSRWYSIDRESVKAIYKACIPIFGEKCFHVMQYIKSIKDDKDKCLYYREIYLEIGKFGYLVIGAAFALSRNVAEDLTEFLLTSTLNDV